jgi:prepilin signal peptidase PulO-like enzyme (type II secretory pathway)
MWMTSNRREVFSLDPIAFTRILLSLVMLGYTSWVDMKTREISIVFSAILSLVLGYMGLFGGADVFAFITLAVLNPFQPRGVNPSLGFVSIIYPLSLFSNSALAGVSFAIFLLLRNLFLSFGGRSLFSSFGSSPLWRKLVLMATGMRVDIEKVRGPPFQYPLETPSEDGLSERKLIVMPDIQDDEGAEDIFRRLKEQGVGEVWVSQTLPFLFFILIGYLVTLMIGDIALYSLIGLLTR